MTIMRLIEELRAVATVHGYGAEVRIQTMTSDDAELVAVRAAAGGALLDIEVIVDNPDAL
jgi:hypothetical protein